MTSPNPMAAPPQAAHADDARADFARLVALFRPYWKWMAAGIAVSLVTLIGNVALMAIAGWFITSMALAGINHVAIDYFTPAAMIRGCAIVRTGGRYIERLVTHEATFRLLAKLRVWFYTRIEPLAPACLQHTRGADLLARIHADIESLNHVYLRVIVPMATGALGTLLIVATMAAFSVAGALVTLFFLALAGVVLPALVFRRTRGPAAAGVAQRAQLQDAVVDDLQGLAELRVYGATERHVQRVERLSGTLIDTQVRLNDVKALSQAALGTCASLAMWGVLLISIPRVSGGTLPAADLAMLALFTLASFEAVMPLPLATQMLGESLAAARRIFALADSAPAVHDPEVATPLTAGNDLRFSHVGMRYPGASRAALDDVSFELPAGRRIAIVGESGAGKSSIANLLLRFWDYEKGSITLGGVELRDASPTELRARIAVVAQDTYLFNATIRENLLLARPDAGADALVAACRTAQLHDFIMSLPQGYDTEIGEAGTRLSGGQARRLAIARGLLLDAPVLILDEPTEGLDTVTEAALLRTIMELMRGRSVLLVTHRLSALAELVDEVIVLDDGHIAQQGPAPALQAANGPFRTLLSHHGSVPA
ncbi:ABC transporter, CydDC cysteine exporter (CydDC-E) family, permease/ATP-binding protein CydC [Burkholderia sp. lig30]|uniref:thiol reductant ABC exporter subunit CydC n=1 Tax=Burkholderia sp. lig30 TaxID=1192124 RepID=UPI000461690E|nr:thiol reductant ABC exporter subunit CydC [Burkholderia sp. lig30]KDB08652.1 ABC transporter, CydDC cysteine exporter (CydDC-E) family, permease/ATP-binding protein CydC [Burkholderia sp. lig30]